MKKEVLIAGGYGFVGRNTARAFKNIGFEVWAIGRGTWKKDEQTHWGIDRWISGEITLDNLSTLDVKPLYVINCAGSSSVGPSFENPLLDYKKTVDSTIALLEFIRFKAPEAKLVQLSSPAVQGVHDDTPIKISDPRNPVSPYGFHKSLAEDKCSLYSKDYGLNVVIIRFFSLYGPGLKKQLLWDACCKIKDNPEFVEFWGSGQETRDWLYIDDAVQLIIKVALYGDQQVAVFNGGSGRRCTIHEVLLKVVEEFNLSTRVTFNGKCRPGDPQFYQADITDSLKLGWKPSVSLHEGIKRYVSWFKKERL
jgi:UDP-glucose 4-epimerase